jgi:hypothetical protein
LYFQWGPLGFCKSICSFVTSSMNSLWLRDLVPVETLWKREG